jgi:hypothetical protein
MRTGYFFDVLEDGAFRLHEDEVLLVGGARREEDGFLPQRLVVLDDVVVDAFLQDEGVVPQLHQVQHLRLDPVPVIPVRTQILEEAALSPHLHLPNRTRFNRESTRFWKDSLLAAWWKFLLQFLMRNSMI